MAQTNGKLKRKKAVVMPLPMAPPPVPLQPSSDPQVVFIGNNLPENLITQDNDHTEQCDSKKARKTAPTVSFSITSSPLLTGDDVFVDSLLTDGIETSPPPMARNNNNKNKLLMMLPKPTSLPSLTISPVSPGTLPIQLLMLLIPYYGNVNKATTPPTPLITTKTTTKPVHKDDTHITLVALLHLEDSPVDNTNIADCC
jgi:hypothetical protein